MTERAARTVDLMRGLYFDELVVGDRFDGVVVSVTESMIIEACGLFQDIAPLHRDVEAARRAGFRALIAPGTLTSGLMIAPIALIAGRASATHLSDLVEFRAAVYAGDTLTISLEVTRVEPRSRFGLVEFRIEARNQDGELAATVTTLMGHKFLPEAGAGARAAGD